MTYRTLEHTADVRLEIRAGTEPALLAEAAAALVATLTEGERPPAREERVVRVDSLDPEDRLVRWMNEVLYLAVTRGFLVASADVTLRPDGLDARVRGCSEAWDRIRTEVKAVTYHGLELEAGDDGLVARVVIDV